MKLSKDDRTFIKASKGALESAATGFDAIPDAQLTGRDVAEILRRGASEIDAEVARQVASRHV